MTHVTVSSWRDDTTQVIQTWQDTRQKQSLWRTQENYRPHFPANEPGIDEQVTCECVSVCESVCERSIVPKYVSKKHLERQKTCP